MNKIKEAVYLASRDFSKEHPDIFVFADFDEDHKHVEIFMEYVGIFLETPKVSRIVTYEAITSARLTWRKVVEFQLNEMERALTNNFMLSRRFDS